MKKSMIKKLAALTVFAALTVQAASTWTGAVDDDWFNSSNWSGNVPGVPGNTTAIISSNDVGGQIVVDAVVTNLAQMKYDADVPAGFAISGSALDFNADSTIAIIYNVSPYSHTIDNDIIVTNSTGVQRNFICGQGMVFNGAITKPGNIMYFEGSNAGSGIFYNGPLTGQDLTLGGAGSVHTFGNTSPNSFGGTLRLGVNDVIVNTAADTTFFNGGNIQINSSGASMTFNNANVLGNSTKITVGSTPDSFVMNFNADEDLGYLKIVTMKGGTLLNLGGDVNSLAFDDCSGQDWNSALVITNFRSGVISFGGDANGLTSEQLGLITAYNTSGADVSSALQIDESGVLVLPDVSGSTWTGAVNDNWYNAGNWYGSVPGTTTNTAATISAGDTEGLITVDAVATNLSQIAFDATVQTNFTISGSTLDFSADSVDPVINNTSAFLHTINSDISVPNSTTNQRDFICGQGMVFNGDISKPGDIMYFEGDNGGNGIFYNGQLSGQNLTLGGYQSTHTFGNTAPNSFSSTLRLGGGIEVIVNTAADTAFFNGPYIQINSGESSMTFNNANVLGDATRITVGSVPDSFLMNFNADEDLGAIRIVTEKGGTVINLGSEVTALSFDDSSAQPWNSGLVITNFRPGVVSFGTSASGLTAPQLALITAYDITGADVSSQLELDASGVLVGPAPVGGYDAWAVTWGATIGAATDDYDGDSCNNFCEYVFNGDPTNANVQGESPQLLSDGSALIYVYAQRNDDASLTYTVENTADLASPSWATAGYTALGTNVTGGSFDYVTNAVSTADAQAFIHVKVVSE